MAISPGEIGTAFNARVNPQINPIRTGDAALGPYLAEQDEVGHEVARALLEEERSPDSAHQMLDRMDGDAQLMRDIIVSRRGIRGWWRRNVEATIDNIVNNNRLSRFTRGASHLAKRVLGSTAVGWAVRSTVGTFISSVPVVGAVTGAATGAFWAWSNSRSQAESASTWMSQLGILNLDRAQIQDETIMNDASLESALGIMRQAIMSGKVRGSERQKLEMISKYRLIRNELQRRRQDAVDNHRDLNPVLARVQSALDGSASEFAMISKAAGERHRETFEKIEKLKKNQVKMAALKGALVGAAAGGIIGFIVSHGGIGQAYESFKHDILNLPTDNAHGAIEAVRDNHGSILGHSPQAQADIAQHNASLEAYHDYYELPADDRTVYDLWRTNHLSEADMTPSQHAAYDRVNHFLDGLSVDQREAIQQLDQLRTLGNDYYNGIQVGTELNQFESLMRAGDHESLYNFAYQHNVDLSYTMPNGEVFGHFLEANRDVFLAMPDDIQQFILSHPAVASEVLNIATHGSTLTTLGVITKRLIGPVLLGGLGVGAYFAHKEKQKLDRQISKEINDPREAASREIVEHRRQQEVRRRQETINLLAVDRVGNRIRLSGPTVSPPRYNPAGFTSPRPNPTDFDIDHIDPDGTIHFVNTDWDNAERQAGNEPHPRVNVNELITANNELDTTQVTLLFRTPQEAQAQRTREENRRNELQQNLEQTRARLTHATVEFIPTATPSYPAAPATRPDNTYYIKDIAPGDILNFSYNREENRLRAAGTVVTLPTIRVQDLIDANNNLDMTRFRILNEEGPEPDATPAPETFDAAQFQPLYNTPLPGTVYKNGHNLRFNIDKGVLPAAQVTLVENALGPVNTEVTVHNPNVDMLPDVINLNAILRNVREGNNGQPEFDADIFFVEPASGARYGIVGHFDSVPANAAAANHKQAAVRRISRAAGAGDLIVFLPTRGGFYRPISFTPGAPLPGAPAGAPGGPGIVRLSRLGGGGVIDIDQDDLMDTDEIYEFIRRP